MSNYNINEAIKCMKLRDEMLHINDEKSFKTSDLKFIEFLYIS